MVHLTVDANEARLLEMVEAKLGKVARNRFRAALEKPSWLLRDRVLKPHLFRCAPSGDITQGSYYPIALVAETPGRNHLLAQRLAACADGLSLDDSDVWSALAYFANALRPCLPDWDENIRQDIWQPPSERVVVASHHIFTFEFDVPDIAFLREQMSWLASRKKASDSAMGRLFARLSGHADFLGLTVCYDGNKSLHIHLTFDMALARASLNLDTVANPRPGFVAHWNALQPVIREILGVANGIEPDAMLRFPEAFRRIPNGHRLIVGDDHILGLPPDTFEVVPGYRTGG